MVIIGQVGDSKIYEEFYESEFKDEFSENWNIKPESSCHVLTTGKPHTFQKLIYGLVPFWSTGRKEFYEAAIDGGLQTEPGKDIKPRIINVPAFRKPIRDLRCIIPADYFIIIEEGRGFLFFHQDRSPLSIAGVYDSWKPNIKQKELYTGFSILTFPAYGIFTQLGITRVPYIVPQNRYRKYIRESSQLLDITRMFAFYPDELLNGYEVSVEKVLSGSNERIVTIPIGKFLKSFQSGKTG
jgi:putative SOS response-associated peptidase YedK